jgi:uncharacterized membrane protein YidH (DUF202 family)
MNQQESYRARREKIKKRKKTQSSFTTLHGILLSLAIAVLVGGIFVLVVIYYHPPPD